MRGPPTERSPADLLSFGVVNLDKPPGPSAHQVAAWVRDLAGADRAAHAGTLDPKVTGCLPVLLGDATRAAQVFDDSRKEYVAVLELHGPAPADLRETVAEFEGEIYQKPPRKSAVRRRLRTRTIHDLDVLETRDRQALLRVACEAGTYIRKLCHDVGLALGTGAHMGDLRRIGTAGFDDTDLVTLHDLADAIAFWEEDGDESWLREAVDPAERVLDGLPSLTVAPSAAREIAHGAPVYAPGIVGTALDDAERGSLVACYTPEGAAVCIGTLVGDPDGDSGTIVDLERVLV
jgi:tRNA pseudouridine55 synthase